MEAAAPVATTTFEPSFDLIQEEDCNTLLLYLPGFRKEELKVQLTSTRDLRISGSRTLENKTLSTFRKDFRVAENCDTTKISAKFEDGILYVRQPKYPTKTTPSASETPQPKKPADVPRPPPKTEQPSPPTPKKNEEPTAKKSADESKEEKKSSEKSSEAEGGKKEKSRKRAEEKTSGGASAAVEEDYNKLNAGSPAARLKAARQQITNALLLLLVFALGIYVSKLPWFSRNEKP